MSGILLDINAQGQGELVLSLLQAPPWTSIWHELGFPVLRFADVGLPADALDSLVWDTCQRLGLVLLTDNRNQDDPDSLEATLRARNGPTSMPIITFANSRRIFRDREYAQRTAVTLLEFLVDIDSLRGTGRLFVP
jgi:hypothetical protein